MNPKVIDGWNAAPGAPVNWNPERDGPCGSLPIRVHPPEALKPGAFMGVEWCDSAWEPTPHELAKLNAGGQVVLRCYGWQIPVSLTVEAAPRAPADETPIPVRGMSFSKALSYIKTGSRVAREGWNGKGMFIFLVPGSKFKVNRPPLLGIYPEGTEICYHSHIDMKTADGMVVPWLCSQTDMLANDWCVLSEGTAP